MKTYRKYLIETVNGKLPKGWDKESVIKLGKTLGISPGEKGFFDK
jgi:hypothetical protein